MTSKNYRRSLMASTVFFSAMLGSAPALAQATPASDTSVTAATPAATDNEVIVVTGSRIPQPNLTSISPITVVNNQEIKLEGTTRIEDLLNSLPQVFAGQASTISNGASGTATVDLRGLGSARTLVLINGRRLLPGDPGSSAADLNAVPASLVKRVEVLTGGASSTYGADAVAGVVNFIMNTEFTGFQIDSQYSLYQHQNRDTTLRAANDARTAAGIPGYGYPDGSTADGGAVDVSATMGAGFDDNHGHVTAYFGYRKVNAVTQNARDYSSCIAQGTSKTTPAVICGGSATSAEGNFFDSTSNAYHVASGQTFAPGLTRYNFAPTNYYQRPDERYTAGFFGHYDISDSIKPYMEAMFMDDRTRAQIAPSGDFGNTLTVNCDNPLLSAQQLAVVCRTDNLINGFVGTYPLTANTNPNVAPPVAFIDPITGAPYNKGYLQLLRRNVEGGPRIADLEHTEYRGVIGVKGDLSPAFSYDAYYQYGRTVYAQTYLGEFSRDRLNNALDVVQTANGPVCRSARSGVSPSCVPYNVFTLKSITPGAINYVSAVGFQRGSVSEQVASGSITGNLGTMGVKTPWADGGFSFNVGAEYRKESLELTTDQEFQTGDLTGQGSPTLPINGSFSVSEFFGEALLPIVSNSFFYDLSLTGGYRLSHYSLTTGRSFNTDTYKFGVNFSPIKDFRVRASYNRAVRAPNIQELFATVHVQLDGASDPCAGPAVGGLVNGNTAAQCASAGVTAAQFGKVSANPAGQYNGQVGGNANLDPERATTKTVGIVFQPSFIPRLSITADYFDISVDKAIQGYGADTILTACVNTGNPTFCNLIHRNPTGSLWLTDTGYVTDLSTNIGGVKTKGVDFTANYSHDIGKLGSLSLGIIGTYLKSLTTDNGLSAPYNCAGYFGKQCGTPNPKWRGKARLTYASPDGVGLSVQWRYFGAVDVDSSSTNTTLAGRYSLFNNHISAQSYFDLASTFRVGDKFTFRLGVNNVLDKSPPIISSNGSLSACPGVTCNGNTFPAVYDALGRYLYAGATIDF